MLTLFKKQWQNSDESDKLLIAIHNLLEPITKNIKILLIGTGHSDEQYEDWPMVFENLGASSIEYIEAYEPNVTKFKDKKYKVTHLEAQNLRHGSFDIIGWFHGPEHVSKEDCVAILNNCKNIATKLVITLCPYGGYYDSTQDSINPYERHAQQDMGPEAIIDSGYETFIVGPRGGPNSAILGYFKK